MTTADRYIRYISGSLNKKEDLPDLATLGFVSRLIARAGSSKEIAAGARELMREMKIDSDRLQRLRNNASRYGLIHFTHRNREQKYKILV